MAIDDLRGVRVGFGDVADELDSLASGGGFGSVTTGVEFVTNRTHLGNIVYGKTWNFTSLPDTTIASIQAHGLTGTYSIIEINGIYRQVSNQFAFNIPCAITGNKVEMYKNGEDIVATTDFNAATGTGQASGTFTIYYIKA